FKRFKKHKVRAGRFLEELMRTNPELFVHWRLARDRRGCPMGTQRGAGITLGGPRGGGGDSTRASPPTAKGAGHQPPPPTAATDRRHRGVISGNRRGEISNKEIDSGGPTHGVHFSVSRQINALAEKSSVHFW